MYCKKRITSFDIAEKARVSQVTVSRVLRGDPSVSKETRQCIEAAPAVPNHTVDKNASNPSVMVIVAGVDDIFMASFVNPPLTTVQQDTRRAGEVLVDNLLRPIHNEPAENRVLPMQLMVRRSSLRQDLPNPRTRING